MIHPSTKALSAPTTDGHTNTRTWCEQHPRKLLNCSSISCQESIRFQKLREHAKNDQEYHRLQNFIFHGFPDHCHQLLEECRWYCSVRNQLTFDDDHIVNGYCLVILEMMRQALPQITPRAGTYETEGPTCSTLARYQQHWKHYPGIQEVPRHPTIK